MTNEILQAVTTHDPEHPILSLYIDMSVNSDNKRTYQTFINKQRTRLQDLDTENRESHQYREALTEVIARAEEWIANEFDRNCKSAIIFAEIGGDWFYAAGFPRPIANRMEIGPQALIGPLRSTLAHERRYCIAFVDREHLRAISTYIGKIEEEKFLEPVSDFNPYDIHAGGGETQNELQRYKAEEERKFFKLFSEHVTKFGQSRKADGYVLLGTDENVKHFKEFLPQQVQDKVVHTAHMPPITSAIEIVHHLEPVFEKLLADDEAQAITQLLDRVKNEHLATSGWHDTLKELQEGKVDTLIIARNETKEGSQCTKCSFYLVRRDGECPYCGGELKSGVDLVESMVRMADGQDLRLAFAASDSLNEVNGVGALLKFR